MWRTCYGVTVMTYGSPLVGMPQTFEIYVVPINARFRSVKSATAVTTITTTSNPSNFLCSVGTLTCHDLKFLVQINIAAQYHWVFPEVRSSYLFGLPFFRKFAWSSLLEAVAVRTKVHELKLSEKLGLSPETHHVRKHKCHLPVLPHMGCSDQSLERRVFVFFFVFGV